MIKLFGLLIGFVIFLNINLVLAQTYNECLKTYTVVGVPLPYNKIKVTTQCPNVERESSCGVGLIGAQCNGTRSSCCSSLDCTDYCSDSFARKYAGVCRVTGAACIYSTQFCQYGCSNGVCNIGCQVGYVDNYTCSGDWIQRQYRHSDCTFSWENYQYCTSGCANGKCNSSNSPCSGTRDSCCSSIDCTDYCSDSFTRKYSGLCRVTGSPCVYSSQYCEYGCSNGVCNSLAGVTGASTMLATCDEGYLDNNRCYGDWIQKEYSNPDCTSSWRDYQNCTYGCENSTCKQNPPDPCLSADFEIQQCNYVNTTPSVGNIIFILHNKGSEELRNITVFVFYPNDVVRTYSSEIIPNDILSVCPELLPCSYKLSLNPRHDYQNETSYEWNVTAEDSSTGNCTSPIDYVIWEQHAGNCGNVTVPSLLTINQNNSKNFTVSVNLGDKEGACEVSLRLISPKNNTVETGKYILNEKIKAKGIIEIIGGWFDNLFSYFRRITGGIFKIIRGY